MKAIVVLLSLIFLASGTPLKGRSNLPRRYLPEENDPHRIKYLILEDENGKMHFEDLTKPVPQTKASKEDLTLYLYTREHPNDDLSIDFNNVGGIQSTKPYDPKKMNYFIIHGWNNDYQSSVNTHLKKAILEKVDANVFVVDWSGPANKMYLTSFSAVPKLGEYVGDFINLMMDHYNLSPKMFRLIGHSLGSHVAGCAGARINGLVDYIVGLDPAGPLYTNGNTDNRLDESDAEFVHVVHTCDKLLGFGSAIGHADYYPNGGADQPGCGLDVVGTCAHSRAYYLFEESILDGNFKATQCDSYKSFKKGKCDTNEFSLLGTLDVDKSASGDYYLYTNKKSPYSQN